jgi:hypothetical protein
LTDRLGLVAWENLRHNYGTAEDVPGLLADCESPDPGVAAQAMSTLDNLIYHQGGWICPAAPAVLPFVVELAADPRRAIRVEALELITSLASDAMRVGSQHVAPDWGPALDEATPTLLRLVSDGDPRVRRSAVYLAGVGGLHPGPATAALRSRLDAEAVAGIRYDIICSLASAVAVRPDSDEARAAGADLTDVTLTAADQQMRLAAVHGLTKLGEPAERHVQLLVDAVTDAGVARWRDSAWLGPAVAPVVRRTGALLTHNPPAALDYAIGVSRHGGADERIAILAHVAALMQEWRAVDHRLSGYLAGELDAAEPAARFRAAYLLAALGREAGPVADRAHELASDDSPVGFREQDTVSDAAVWALARAGDTRSIPFLRARLAGGRLGFAVQEVHYSKGAFTGAFTMPSISAVVERADPGAELLDAAMGWLRSARRNDLNMVSQFCRMSQTWGVRASAAVPDLRRVLRSAAVDRYPGPAAAKALGRIGPPAGAAVKELRRYAAQGSSVAVWALWRVTGDQRDAAALLNSHPGGNIRHGTLRLLADLGTLAAPLEGRFRELLRSRQEWARAEAAHALWCATGDSDAAVPVLASLTSPLRSGRLLPVSLAALRYLSAIPGAVSIAPEVRRNAEAVLANPRRVAWSGDWRAYAEDDEVRAIAARFAAARQS